MAHLTFTNGKWQMAHGTWTMDNVFSFGNFGNPNLEALKIVLQILRTTLSLSLSLSLPGPLCNTFCPSDQMATFSGGDLGNPERANNLIQRVTWPHTATNYVFAAFFSASMDTGEQTEWTRCPRVSIRRQLPMGCQWDEKLHQAFQSGHHLAPDPLLLSALVHEERSPSFKLQCKLISI